MQLGIHAFAWCTEWSNDTLDILDKVKKENLEFVGIPLLKLENVDTKAVLARRKAVGIDVVTSTVIQTDDRDITSPNPAYRRAGIEHLRRCIDTTAALESDSFSGVLYSKYCKADVLPTEDDWKWSAEGLHELGEYAQQYGITLGLEPVTRYESNLINTCEEAIRLLDMIGLPNVKVHLDTYHMNVEEKSFYEATKLAKGRLCHYHMCECDRGIPGTGHVDWDGIFRALKENDYHGRIGMEGFSDLTESMNSWVWRKLAPDGDTFLREGIRFLREMIAKYEL